MTRKTLTTALIAALTLTALAGPAVKAAERTMIQRQATPSVVLSNPGILKPVIFQFTCKVQGTPTEFPNDIAISHGYSFTVPAGTKVYYTAPYGNSGVITLPALGPGKFHHVSNAVPGGAQAGAPCSASQV